MPNSIEFNQVSKNYGEKSVLNDLSLQLKIDTTTAIVGESGSGKSTLLQMSNGLVQPDTGTVSVLGEALNRDNIIGKRLLTGYSVQGAALFPHLTVFENVTLMARLQHDGQEEIEERFARLLELFELDGELRDRYPYSLSGGQQQRVSLCRAMMLDPPLLLLDEPFSALDPLTRDSIHQEFLKLQRLEQRSIILVTHDMAEAMILASEIVVLANGQVEQHGSVAEIRENPASDYVRSLFQAGSE